MALNGGEYLVTGTATSIASALSITDPGFKAYKRVILRNSPSALNDAYFGRSDVTTSAKRHGVLRATDTYATVLGGGDGETLNIDQIFLIGTANAANIIFISLIS